MKKLLLALPIITTLVACGGGIESDVEELAHNYCEAVKRMDWRNAEPLAKPFVLANRQGMHEQNKGKYAQVFMNQNCNVTKVGGNEGAWSVFYGGSELDSVEIEWDKRKEQFFVVSDAFKADLNLY